MPQSLRPLAVSVLLGILGWLAILLWPHSDRAEMDAAATRLAAIKADETARLDRRRTQFLDADNERTDAAMGRFTGLGRSALRQAAEDECRRRVCDSAVLDAIYEAASGADRNAVHCYVEFEESEWSCRTGKNAGMCNPKPCP